MIPKLGLSINCRVILPEFENEPRQRARFAGMDNKSMYFVVIKADRAEDDPDGVREVPIENLPDALETWR